MTVTVAARSNQRVLLHGVRSSSFEFPRLGDVNCSRSVLRVFCIWQSAAAKAAVTSQTVSVLGPRGVAQGIQRSHIPRPVAPGSAITLNCPKYVVIFSFRL